MLFWVFAVVVTTTCLALLLGRNSSLDEVKAGYLEGDLSQTIASIDTVRKKPLTADLLLLAANCYRQLGQSAQFRDQIEKAKSMTQSKDGVELAVAMYKIQNGQLDDSPQKLVEVLQSAGAIESDANSVVVQSAFANDKLALAKELIDNWRRKQPNSVQLQYLTAVYLETILTT